MPSGESISREQKKRANSRPSFEVRHAFWVQLSANALSVILRRTGLGSLMIVVVVVTCKEAM